jgi:hypothetical protein
MDPMTLLDRAHGAGLAIASAGDKLIVRGPRRAEPMVRLLAVHKCEILAALAEATGWLARHREAQSHWGALHPATRPRGSLGLRCKPVGTGCTASWYRSGTAPGATNLSAAGGPCRSATATACISTMGTGSIASSPMASAGAVPRRLL